MINYEIFERVVSTSPMVRYNQPRRIMKLTPFLLLLGGLHITMVSPLQAAPNEEKEPSVSQQLASRVDERATASRQNLPRLSGVRYKEDSTTAQQQVVSGTVTDVNGNPLAGVTVRVTGTDQVTVTNDQGEYRVTVAGEQKSLSFSAIGFQEFDAAIEGRSTIDVSLIEVVSDLDEVVVVGYGTATKGDLTGSL